MKRRNAIKILAKKIGKKPKDLLVLAQYNDPFYVGSKTQYANAEWATILYHLLGIKTPVHIRRLHYFALTQPQHRKPNGSIYKNTNADWKFLGYACKFARYLGLLSYDNFVDHRAVQHIQKWPLSRTESPDQWPKQITHTLERFRRSYVGFMLSKLLPVHIEIWVEKSTAAYLLSAITEKYHITVITSMGDISLSAVWQFIKRVSRSSKPVRIFYISDFDPSGENMPISVARKIEFLLRQQRLSRCLDVKLKPLMLTRRQCKKFHLPGIPLPDTFTKNYSFTRYHGRIATELHALEAVRPGHICNSVDSQLKKYLALSKLTRAAGLADNVTTQLFGRIGEMIEKNTDFTAFFKTAEKLLAQNISVKECDFYEPWLFDSKRDYMTQLLTYHMHRLR